MSSPLCLSRRRCLRSLQWSALQKRSFSSTPNRQKHGALTTFPQTSSPELDEILSTLSDNVFLPSHLRTPQKHLVYRKHYQHYLTGEEPVKVELPTIAPGQADRADAPKKEFTLKPLDKRRDEPKFKATWNRIINLLSSDGQDWALLPNLLREFHLAGYSIKPHQIEKMIRRAGQQDKTGIVVECFSRPDTNLRLSTSGIAQQMLLAAHWQALNANFAEKELDKAIKHVSFVLRMIQDKNHITAEQPDDPKRWPETYGSALALFAIRRLLWETENTDAKRSARIAAQATPEVEQTTAEAEAVEKTDGETPAEAAAEEGAATPKDAYALGEHDIKSIESNALRLLGNSENAVLEFDESVLRECDNFIQQWVPTWYGIQITQRLASVDPDIKQRLKGAFDAEIDPAVKRAVEAVRRIAEADNSKGQRALSMYEKYSQRLL